MKRNIKSLSAFILLLIAVVPCFARSYLRSNPPTLEISPSLSGLSSLNGSLTADPDLKILRRVPHDVTMRGYTLRITSLKSGPFMSSFKVLPCMIDMVSTSFDAVWDEAEQHAQLVDDKFWCSENSLTLQVLSQKPPLKGMEYSDLVKVARLLLNFQQEYKLPGIGFQYLDNGQKMGTGDLDWNYAANSSQDLEQE